MTEGQPRKDFLPRKDGLTIQVLPALTGEEAPHQMQHVSTLRTLSYLDNFGARDDNGELAITFSDAAKILQEGDKHYTTIDILGQLDLRSGQPSAFGSTLRLLLGQPGMYPVEAARTFRRPDGWRNNPQEMGEIGRLAFMPAEDYRLESSSDEAKKIRAQLLASKTIRAAQEGQKRGMTELLAVMPGYIHALYEMEEIVPELIKGAALIESEENKKELFDKFPRYWRNTKYPPMLYRWDVEQLAGKNVTKRATGIIVPPRKSFIQ